MLDLHANHGEGDGNQAKGDADDSNGLQGGTSRVLLLTLLFERGVVGKTDRCGRKIKLLGFCAHKDE